MKYCIKCGAPVNEGQPFCQECGFALNAAQNAAEQPAPQQEPEQVQQAPEQAQQAQPEQPEQAQPQPAQPQQVQPEVYSYTYGAPQQPVQPPVHATKQGAGMSIASLVLGIVSFLVCCCGGADNISYIISAVLVLVTGALSLIFGIVALSKKAQGGYKAMAIIGVVLGGLSTLTGLLRVILVISGFNIEEYIKQMSQIPME
ncbi:MAG: zinc-ribbon domain-containing protein [Firmicutes bacterium]|nr:zinc-ribbon domain-containing protein [Bacillota bacterium]